MGNGFLAWSADLPTPSELVAIILFSLIGMGVFMYGKKLLQVRMLALGVALMVYPYFVSATWALWAIGLGLCAAVYYFRE